MEQTIQLEDKWLNLNLQCSDNVVSKHLLVSKCDSEWPILLGLLVWPVLLTLPLTSLHNIGEHHNDLHLLLPHKPPDICESIWQWAYQVRERRGLII